MLPDTQASYTMHVSHPQKLYRVRATGPGTLPSTGEVKTALVGWRGRWQLLAYRYTHILRALGKQALNPPAVDTLYKDQGTPARNR